MKTLLRLPMCAASVLFATCGLSSLAVAQSQNPLQNRYVLHRVGLYDPPRGVNLNSYINEPVTVIASAIAGRTERVNIDGTARGFDAWIFDAARARTLQVALPGEIHRDITGNQTASINAVNSQGYITGTVSRHAPNGVRRGTSAWLFEPQTGQIIQIGLDLQDTTSFVSNSPEFSNQGLRYFADASAVITPAGQVLGRGAAGSAWVFDPVARMTRAIGLQTPVHVRPDQPRGVQQSLLQLSNGIVVGTTQAIGPSEDAWWYNPQTQETQQLGLTGPAYTSADGRRVSAFIRLDSDPSLRFIAGFSQRMDLIGIGYDFWLFDTIERAYVSFGIRTDSQGNPIPSARTPAPGRLTSDSVLIGSTSGLGTAESTWLWRQN